MKPSGFYILIFALLLSGCLTTQAPAPVFSYNPGDGAGSTGIHTVLGNETLWLISKRYNIAARDIAVANNLQAPFTLARGQRLRLPPPQQYSVRAGDSLNTISKLFGVPHSEIAKMNNLRAPYTLAVGQNLRLPAVTQKSAPMAFAQATKLAPVYQAPVVAEILAPPPMQQQTLQAPQGQQPSQQTPQHVLRVPESKQQQMQVAAAPQAQAVIREPVKAKKPEPESPVTAKVPKRASSKFLRPVKGKVISAYGPKDNGQFNDGMNILAPRDTPVAAAENGVVVYAGSDLKGSGNLVLIRHDNRWMTAYAHLGDIKVKKGAVIKRGEKIGTVGSSGAVDVPQLHFEVRRGTEALNPQVYLEG